MYNPEENYLHEIHNRDENFEKILQKTKGVKIMKKKMMNVAAIFVIVVLAGTLTNQIYAKRQWEIAFQDYQSRPVGETKGNLEEIRNSEYAEVLNMEAIEQEGICIKVDSILLTDDCFDAKLKFQFAENISVNSKTFQYGFAVYDENNNIYAISTRVYQNKKRDQTIPFFYKELGVKYNKSDIYAGQLMDSCSLELGEVNENERTIVQHITIRAKDTFPKSKTLFIQLFDLGYDMYERTEDSATIENFNISDAKWKFEIEVPEKFYERNTMDLKLAQEIPGFEIERATLTETSLVLVFHSPAYCDLIARSKDIKSNEAIKEMLSITNCEGNVYQEQGGGTRGDNRYKMTLDVGKKDWEKQLLVHFKENGKEYVSELIEK